MDTPKTRSNLLRDKNRLLTKIIQYRDDRTFIDQIPKKISNL